MYEAPRRKTAHSEKDDLQIHEVTGVKILVSSQPLRSKCDETTVKLPNSQDDHPESHIRISLDKAPADPDSQHTTAKDRQQL